ncbi:BMP family ABC transporter substrate-binding protein [bacterium]|nr:BMP family ABC transporter substrate-binding protein [bacterium]
MDQFFEEGLPNLVGMQSREDQGGFVVGAMAAALSQSGTIGGVYGINVPAVVKFRNGYEQGACYVNPEIQSLGAYTDAFDDPDQGQAVAEAIVGQGADVIFGAGGGTGSGAIAWAAQQGIFVIGVDQDEYFTTFGGGTSPARSSW